MLTMNCMELILFKVENNGSRGAEEQCNVPPAFISFTLLSLNCSKIQLNWKQKSNKPRNISCAVLVSVAGDISFIDLQS